MDYTHDLIVIGAGSAGLTVAGGIAMFGRRVALIEGGEMGGECLNTGCIPSKALLAVAARANQALEGERMGVSIGPPRIDWKGVRSHVEQAIAAIAQHDSQERFEAMGVDVIRAGASFLSPRTVRAGNREIRAPRIVIATGSKPAIPPINGLKKIPYLTNETLFALKNQPRHLAIIGAGAMGMEMAQAFKRLGSEVTVIARGRPLGRDDEEAAALVAARLQAEGVRFLEGEAQQVERAEDGIELTCTGGERIEASHLLIATGREANVDGLALEKAGIAVGEDGIEVDRRRRTSNRSVYAIGDCRAGPQLYPCCEL